MPISLLKLCSVPFVQILLDGLIKWSSLDSSRNTASRYILLHISFPQKFGIGTLFNTCPTILSASAFSLPYHFMSVVAPFPSILFSFGNQRTLSSSYFNNFCRMLRITFLFRHSCFQSCRGLLIIVGRLVEVIPLTYEVHGSLYCSHCTERKLIFSISATSILGGCSGFVLRMLTEIAVCHDHCTNLAGRMDRSLMTEFYPSQAFYFVFLQSELHDISFITLNNCRHGAEPLEQTACT